jgi:putative membrane protein
MAGLLADTWGMHGGWGAGWMILMMVGMVLFWTAIVFGIVWLIRGGSDRRQAHRAEPPTEVLDRRFAEGAISVEDYRQRRNILGNGPSETNGARKSDTPAPSIEGSKT